MNDSVKIETTTNLYAAFATNKSIETDGVVVKYGPKTSVRIARAGGSNTAFSKRYEALMRPYKRLAQTGQMDAEVSADIMRRLYAETVVKDWEGVTNREGVELDFTVDNAMALFKDLPDLFDDLVSHSMNATLYREEVREADSKN